MYALKFFTKSGKNKVLAMPSKEEALKIVEQMRVNGRVIQIGRAVYRLSNMDNVWIDDEQVYPQRLTQPITLDMGVRR